MRLIKQTFLTALATTALALPGLTTANAAELKISHFVPPVHQIHKELDRWAKELDRRSSGKLKASIFPAGQMGPPPRQFDLARTGVADIAFLFPALSPGRFELTGVLRAPFLFNKPGNLATPISTAEASYVTTTIAPELASEYPGVKILNLITATTNGLFMSKASIRKIEDLRGKRIRHNGKLIADNVAAWGGTPVGMGPAGITDALSKGTIDGAVFNFEAAKAFRFAKVVRKVTPLNWTSGTFAVVMNKARYDGLEPALRKMIDSTTGPEAARRIGATYDNAGEAGRKYMLDAGVEIVTPTPQEFEKFRSALTGVTQKLIDGLEARDRPAKKLLAQVRELVAKSAN